MTKKDLFDGLNYIDDQIIEEAQPTGESAGYSDEIYVKNHETHHGGKEDKNRKKHKKFARAAKALATVAAVLVVAMRDSGGRLRAAPSRQSAGSACFLPPPG